MELTIEQEAEIDMELAEVRAWLAAIVPAHSEFFGIRAPGGRWAKKHRDLSWDSLQGYAQGYWPW